MALRLFSLLLALLLAACITTPVPSGHSRSSSAQHTRQLKTHHGHLQYLVRRGDTLYSIGRRFGVDYHLLARRNHLRAPYEIYVGQYLYITSVAPRSQRLPVAETPARRVTKNAPHSAARKKTPTRHQSASAIPGKMLWPVRGKITSAFGRRGSRMHDGIDIGVDRGTPIHAAASGEVVYSDQRLSGYGKLVIIRHAGNVFTAYAHNQRNLVRKGDRVRAGEIIARVGSSGRASGPHLHFEVRRGSTPVDPLAYLPRR
ncbi:MAG TPA: M23 family metallopeptidase [Mariprofundaceae bacterium]|nr:M23 family metallopeptidase [Mariprofundaceae bacterium]